MEGKFSNRLKKKKTLPETKSLCIGKQRRYWKDFCENQFQDKDA